MTFKTADHGLAKLRWPGAAGARWGAFRRVLAIRVVTIAIMIVAWEALARSGLLYGDVVPSWLKIAPALVNLLATPAFYGHLAVTLGEIGTGLGLAIALGVPLGILFGAQRFVGDAVEPYVVAIATTPKIVFLPIIMLAVGVGLESKVALGALSAIFPIILTTTAGLRQVRQVHLWVGYSFNISWLQMVTKIYLPSIVQPVAIGVRLGLGVCVIGVLLGEIKLSNAGLGFMASDFYNLFRIPELYALLIVIFGLAVAANALVGLLIDRIDRE